MASDEVTSHDFEYTLDVENLDFAYSSLYGPKQPNVLTGMNLKLPPGSRCILVGSNGAGKSTLLQILAGKKLIKKGALVLGNNVFFDTPAGLCYLGTEWAANPVVRSDLEVSHFLDSVGGAQYPERRDRLVELMDVDLSWHMHQVSDGERRRVQIVSGLMAPWRMLLLDEVTVDLDVLVRQRLLNFLKEECKTRGATILYATHIFDGLDSFPSHLCHIQLGSTLPPSPLEWPLKEGQTEGIPAGVKERMADANRPGSKLLELVLAWLIEDRQARIAKEIAVHGRQKRGAQNGEKDPKDGESFYNKYDYSS